MSDSSSPAASTPTASGLTSAAVVTVSKSKAPLPSRNACLACRAQKTRCNPVEGSDKCARCFRHDLDCVHKKHARGPKRKHLGPEDGEPKPKRQSMHVSTSSTGTLSDAIAGPSGTHSYDSPVTVSKPIPPSERIEPPSFSLDTILCESRPDEFKDPLEQYSDFFDDPVALNMLSEHKAEALFDFFYERMNPFISLLDPALHTAKYVRRCSSLLYTAVLAVTSKFIYRDIYVACLRLAHGRLASACINGPPKIEVIQAISLLTFWKEPSDQNSWRRIGVSIRMAYELGLHKMYRRPLPGDDLDARKVLNRERTWLHLICFDRTTAYQRDLPTMISRQFAHDPAHWMSSIPEELRTLLDYDIDSSMAAGVIKFRIRKVHQTLNKFRASLQIQSGHPSPTSAMNGMDSNLPRVTEHDILEQNLLLKDLRVDVDKWKERWLGEKCTVNLPTSLKHKFALNHAVLNLNLCITTFELDVLRDALSDTLRIERIHHGHCVSAALSLLTDVNDLAASGMLLYTQDAVAVGFATAILWLSLHSNVFETETLMTVDRALKATKDFCLRASKQPKDAPAYFCRFIDRFGQTFSTVLSRRASPVPTHAIVGSSPVDVRRRFQHSSTPGPPSPMNGVNGGHPSYQNGAFAPQHHSAPTTADADPFSWDPTAPPHQLPTPPAIPQQPQPGPSSSQQYSTSGNDIMFDMLPARQSLIDFFTFDQNYWTAVAPQASLQNYLQTQTSPDPASFSPTTASALSTYLGW